MSDILRVYCRAERHALGVPLDWHRCRGSDELEGGMGSLHEALHQNDMTCPQCDGHGSLRAAALARMRERMRRRITPDEAVDVAATDALSGLRWEVDDHVVNPEGKHVYLKPHPVGRGITDCCEVVSPCERHAAMYPLRCEGCGHPMSDGTWVEARKPFPHVPAAEYEAAAVRALAAGREPGEAPPIAMAHWSPCDKKCRHREMLRVHGRNRPGEEWVRESDRWSPSVAQLIGPAVQGQEPWRVEASWRAVDVRTIGLPFDLRPENLAVLCLRCYASRTP